MANLIVCNHAIRFHDNPLLQQAGSSPVFLYVLDPQLLYEQVDRWSQARTHFLIQGLNEFANQLKALGYVLNFAIGAWAEQVHQVALTIGAEKILCASPLGWREQQALQHLGNITSSPVISYNCDTLFEAEQIKSLFPDIPNIFSSFRRHIEKADLAVKTTHKPDLTPANWPQAEIALTLDDAVSWLNARCYEQSSSFWQLGGESAGLNRVDEYIWQTQAIRDYKNTRNGLSGRLFSTQFSPWLASGALSARYIWQAVTEHELQFQANDSTYWVKFELLWREFFHWQHQYHGNAWFSRNGIQGPRAFAMTALGSTQQKYLNHWQQGTTANDFINANMRMLSQTGWMSNRGRQNVASYLIHELGLDWRLGALWFESQLVDYDVASNWGNWAYLAGVGNDPRGSRRFNIDKQAQTHDPAGEFVREWLSERGR
ncbi:MAG: DASH family cryptochrome [Moraxellaceae bacterium]|nr:DASH family cryptochrome [Moraxellaceae bacterium]